VGRGKLRIYLGAAPGVGKTYAMLNEGWRRHLRGTDVVVGYLEAHNRPNTAAQLRDLEVVGRRGIEYRGQQFEEMDVDALLGRRPAVALIDELAHTNVPGSRNPKRWQDVEELLAAGIEVISTVNIQHLESLNDVVQRITGATQQETIPDAVVRGADQVELIDMAPEALRRRMAHGNVYAAERVDAALANYFRIGNLSALRELALLWVADKVDDGLHAYRERHGIAAPWETKERVVVAFSGAPQAARLIRRAARMAARTRAELVGVHVRTTDGLAEPPTERLDEHRALLGELGGRYEEITGSEIATALAEFAQGENATQLVLGASQKSRWSEMLHGSVINRVIRAAGGIDVHIISPRAGDDSGGGRPARARLPGLPRPRRLAPLPRRREIGGWVAALVGMPVLALAMAPLRASVGVVGALPALLVGAIGVAMVGGVWPGVTGAVVGFLVGDWLFIPPIHTLTINRAADAFALATFLLVAVTVALLVDQLARRRLETARARSESEALARLAGGALGWGPEALPSLLADLRATFGLQAVAILTPVAEGWAAQSAAGSPVPSRPEEAQFTAALGGGATLALSGTQLAAGDRRVLSAFVAQLRLAREQGRLQAQAASAEQLSETNELRTALLAGVSHDLRTPLASIKAAATSLLSTEITWSAEAVTRFSETINDEADRLNALVGNLLDMSRLQTGVLPLDIGPVGLDEVVFAALASLSRDTGVVQVDVPETLPRVLADAALLERAIANLVDNALTWAPPDRALRVEAGPAGDGIDLRVVDRGPGIPEDQRDVVFRPFQRLGDGSGAPNGVGLGLAVAKGFVEAMGGELTLEDTPGGGLTSVIRLAAAPVAAAAP